ncbi:MAG: 50S ribosomal protein L15 [Verrucomicrobiae bacterium]|nr:50S ribosomal protein L15 [Verrucomicrobiae bacterium]
MRLHHLNPVFGAKHRSKRLGCGESSGHGKTSCRGGKGQTARSGSSIRLGFEGGQTPLYRRMPKRGFNNKRFKRKVAVVNVAELNEFPDGAVVDVKALLDAGLIRGGFEAVKILGGGELKKKLTVQVHLLSESARKQIEAAGGTISLIPEKVSEKGKLAEKKA